MQLKGGKSKGQTTIELLILLVVSLIALAIIYSLYAQQLEISGANQNAFMAKSVIQKIVTSANALALSGAGAETKIEVDLPEDLDFENSGFEGKTVYLRLDTGSDLVGVAEVDLDGFFREVEGKQFLYLYYDGSSVKIHYNDFEVNKKNISIAATQGTIVTESFTIRNNYLDEIDFVLTPNYSHSDVSLQIDSADLSFTLQSKEVRSIDINFVISSSANGNYSGSIDIVGTAGSDTFTRTLTLSAESYFVLSEILLFPRSVTFSASPNSSIVEDFSICNSSDNPISITSWSKDGNAEFSAEDWFTLPSINSVGANSCEEFDINFNVPQLYVSGTYDTNITANLNDGNSYTSYVYFVVNYVPSPYTSFRSVTNSTLIPNFNSSFFLSTRIDANNFDNNRIVPSGELDTNLLQRNDYGSGTAFSKTGDELSISNPLYDSNLVSLWHFNDKNSSNYILNSRTFAYDGNLVNGADVNAQGLWDTNAGFFDGVDDYVNISGLNNMTNGSMTFSAWIYRDEYSVRDVVFGSYSQANNINFEIYSDNFMRIWWNNGQIDVRGTFPIPSNKWVLYTIVRNVSENKFYSYIDGELKNTFDGVGSNFVTNNQYFIGKDTRDGTTAFKGKMDEVTIWNRALSASEISELYLSQAGEFSEPSLVGVYHFDNNVNDLSGKGNDGVWSGTESYASGLFGTSAASFNGASYVLANDQTNLDKYTVSAWVYRQTTAVEGVVLFQNTTTLRYVRLFANSTVSNTFEFDSTPGEIGNLNSGTNAFASNRWVHVAVSFDGTTGRLYLNGSLKSLGTFDMNAFGTNRIYLGTISSVSNKMNGKLDEVIIWDKALSDDQIRKLYTQQKGEWMDSNLVFYQNFDSVLGTTIHDNARGFNGTLGNGALITKGLWDSNSIYFDGSNDYAYFGNFKADVNRKMTISLWVNPTKIDDYKTLFQDTNGTSASWALQNKYQTTNGYSWYWTLYTQKGIGYAGLTCGVKNNRVLGQWQQVALTYDADTNTAKIYYDGIYCPGNAGNIGGEITNPNSYLRGLTMATSSSGFRGYVDEVKIYDRVLSDEEILEDYNRVRNNPAFVDSNLVDSTVITQGTSVVWDSIKVNSKVGYDFGKEIESWSDLSEKGINELGSGSNADYLFDSNLVGLWHLDDKNSQNWVLNSATGLRDGQLYFGADVNAKGFWDTNAAFFDGVNDYLGISDSDALEPTDITVSMWVNSSSWTHNSVATSLVSKRASASDGYFIFYLTGASSINWDWCDTSQNRWNTGYNPPLNVWVNLVFTRNSSGRYLYVDGKLYSWTSVAGTSSAIPSTASLWVGNDGSGYPFKGSIEETAIWSRALTQSEVNDLYNSQKPMFQNGLVGLWHLNNDAIDYSSSKNFVVRSGSGNVEVLVVAGGGGGGARHGGGGGAGGLIYNSNYFVTSGVKKVIVGDGGIGGVGPATNNTVTTSGSAGGNSVFDSIIATGGGGGRGYPNNGPGGAGGSGGGGGSAVSNVNGGTATLSPVQGNNGGNGQVGGTDQSGGGGGGAGSAGTNGLNAVPGNGGAGLSYDINGTLVYYAGGGGGGGSAGTGGTATAGGGAGGNTATANGTAGTNGLGGGGGGARTNATGNGAKGGSGIVIVRYPTGTLDATGGTITYDGNYTIHTFRDTNNTNGVWAGTENYSTGLFDTNAASLNASSYIDINDDPKLNPKNALSISFWIYPNIDLYQMSNWTGIISKGTYGASYQWGCMKYDTTTVDENRIICMLYYADGNSLNLTTNTLIFGGKWYHVVFVVDAINGTKKMYVNGVLDNSGTASIKEIRSTTSPLSIGRNRIAYSEYFNGKIEEVALYDRALLDSEVTDLYRKGVARLDLNVYSCIDSLCENKNASQLLTNVQNGLWNSLSLLDSNYLGYEAQFNTQNIGDSNVGNFWVGSFLQDVNIFYRK